MSKTNGIHKKDVPSLTLSDKTHELINNSLKAKKIYTLCQKMDKTQLDRMLVYANSVTSIKT